MIVMQPNFCIPGPLSVTFYLNPLTYIVDITRAGIFSQVDTITNIEVLIITLVSVAGFVIAIRSIVTREGFYFSAFVCH
jgi:ABC-2 type transport system permease protein